MALTWWDQSAEWHFWNSVSAFAGNGEKMGAVSPLSSCFGRGASSPHTSGGFRVAERPPEVGSAGWHDSRRARQDGIRVSVTRASRINRGKARLRRFCYASYGSAGRSVLLGIAR